MLSYDVTEWGKPLQKAIRETPAPQGTEVLVKIQYCGVCHSDVHIRDGYFDLGGGKKFHMGERGMDLPVTMGHEPYGTVVAAGPDAGDVPIGAERLVFPWIGCGNCARCAAEQDNLCPAMRSLGVRLRGGYADYMIVPHPKYLVDASGIEPSYAPILACSGLTTYSAINKLMPCDPDDWIAVLGAGGLGLMAVSILRALGHRNIAAGDVDPAKFAAAREAGATHTFDTREADATARLAALPGGLWGAIDLVGASSTAEIGYGALRRGGRHISVGLFGGELHLSTVTVAQRAATMQGSYVGSLPELKELVELARSGKLTPIPVSTCGLDEVSGVLDRLKAGTVTGRIVAKL